MRTSLHTLRQMARARATSVRPSSMTNALSVPMRVLFPPARTKTVTSVEGPGIPAIILGRSYWAHDTRKTSG